MGIVRPSTFNLQPSTLATRRSAIKGLAGILAAGIAPSLCAAVTCGYRRGLGMKIAAMALPYDAEVEYLESTGTQYIDTGVNFSSVLAIEDKIELTEYNVNFHSYYDNTQGSTIRYYRYAPNVGGIKEWQFYCGTKMLYSTYPLTTGFIYTIFTDPKNKILRVNGDSLNYGYATNWTGKMPFFVFAESHVSGSGETITPQSLRVYSVRLMDNDVLARDFIPVRVGNIGYMYDRVRGKLFGNAGTGTFNVGPDKT